VKSHIQAKKQKSKTFRFGDTSSLGKSGFVNEEVSPEEESSSSMPYREWKTKTVASMTETMERNQK